MTSPNHRHNDAEDGTRAGCCRPTDAPPYEPIRYAAPIQSPYVRRAIASSLPAKDLTLAGAILAR